MLDALGDLLSPYSEIIGAVAGTVTTLQSVSGLFFLNNIRKKGSTDGFSPAPFIGGIVITILTLKLSTILSDKAMIRSNLIGLLINIAYLSFFLYYTPKASIPSVLKKLGICGLFALTCVTYATFEDPEKIEFRFGLLLVSIFVVLLGMPLLKVGEIIKNKSAEHLPFPMILTGSLIGFLWLTYAISVKKSVLIYQNGFLLTLVLPQLILCLMYPGKSTKEKTSEEKSVKRD